MIEMDQILELLRTVAELPFDSVEVSTADLTVRTSRGLQTGAVQHRQSQLPPVQQEPIPTQQQAEELTQITSPIIGVFYAASSPDDEPFVQVGDTVRAGQSLCIVEAMKLMNEIPSPETGIIHAVLQQDGSEVEVGTPLFLIERQG